MDIKHTLKKGASGDEVKYLQECLNLLGYDCGIADGKFGKNTEAAVKNFQKNNDLTVDGIVGLATWHTIESYMKPQENVDPELPVDNDSDDKYEGLRARLEEIEALVNALKEDLENL